MATASTSHFLDRWKAAKPDSIWGSWKGDIDKDLAVALGRPAPTRRMLAPARPAESDLLGELDAAQD